MKVRSYFRRGHGEALANEAGCLNLVVSAVILWNTMYMYLERAIEHLRRQDYPVRDDDIALLWPTRHEHINVHGKLKIDIEAIESRSGYRPLWVPESSLDLPPLP